LPLIGVFFGDETIEIRRKVLATLAPVVETLGTEAAEQHILPDVIRMAQDPQWRVRLSVVETLPIYAKHMGMDLFNQMREYSLYTKPQSAAPLRDCSLTPHASSRPKTASSLESLPSPHIDGTARVCKKLEDHLTVEVRVRPETRTETLVGFRV
jgi:hypothetical protein